MSKKSFRIALAVVVGVVVVVLAVGGWLIYQILQYPTRAHHGHGAEVHVTIKPHSAVAQVAAQLRKAGVIDHPTWFKIYVMRRGATGAIKAGDYTLRDDMKPKDVLDTLIAGVKEHQVEVTLKEGQNMLEYFAELARNGVAKADELETLARDPAFLQAHGISGDSVDGYLMPDTYRFVVPTPPKKVLERLINAHNGVWNDLAREHAKALDRLKDRLKWSDRDVLVLASIVEKEAVDPAERPRIAQVFVNRLTSPSFKPKRLETDPTIRYGCLVSVHKSAACVKWNEPCVKDGKPMGCDRLHRIQLDDVDNPYNTYVLEGLPPGPIGNPGKSSMEAAIEPDGSDYFYFVSKDHKHHHFSRTLAEHKTAEASEAPPPTD